MISTDNVYTGAGIVTPPAAGVCSADRVVRMAPYAAPQSGTGLPIAGTATAARLRAVGTPTGQFALVPPFVQTSALRDFAVAGVPTGHTSSTPGDLPPEDPLS